ncbi:M66 family metalloprotease [Ideonella paludis]|uniref:M66 family metalloprotease n=1 Tax=Ideonella paludis TaxID=1233411 RepID=UPI00363E2D3C
MSSWVAGALVSAVLTACGGGGGEEAATAPTAPEAPALSISRLQLAQTHVIPAEGRHWSLEGAEYRLTLVGQRAALLMVDLGSTAPSAPWVEGWVGDTLLGTLPLNPPSQLPKSAGQAATYDTQLHSATLPATWAQPGLRLRFGSGQHSPSAWTAVTVGMDSRLALHTLPFYLFGATEANTFALSSTGAPSPAVSDEIFSVWPIASLQASNHPASQVAWPTLVVGPRNGQAAKVLRNSSEQRDGFDIMNTVLGLIGGLRSANGDSGTNTLYYAPLLMLDSAGRYANPYGGLGTVGGGTGTGDHSYSGIFIHEAGHSLGLGHANDDYNAKRFPYPNGSLNGSAWGYDAVRQQLVAPWLDASNPNFASCLSSSTRQKDAQGRCFKQDNMQSGAGDQPAGFRYQMHADANVGRIQTFFLQGKTSVAADGTHQYSQGLCTWMRPARPATAAGTAWMRGAFRSAPRPPMTGSGAWIRGCLLPSRCPFMRWPSPTAGPGRLAPLTSTHRCRSRVS